MNRAGRVAETVWYGNCIGIVKVEQADKEIKYYIGYVDYEDLTEGAYEIALWGFEFPKEAAEIIFAREAQHGLSST